LAHMNITKNWATH